MPSLGDEAAPHRAPDLGADRDVLQVRVGAREPAGRRGHLVEGGVDPARLRIDQVRQRVQVGVLELGELAPALDLGDDLVLVADLGEHARVGREAGLAAPLLGQPQLFEEDLAELLRRADRELVAGELVDLALELGDPLRHALADLRETLRVELDAGALHGGEHLDQRHLDLVEHALEPELLDLLALAGGELEGQAGLGRRDRRWARPRRASESCSLSRGPRPALAAAALAAARPASAASSWRS